MRAVRHDHVRGLRMNEYLIHQAPLGRVHVVTGANSQPPRLRIGDRVRLEDAEYGSGRPPRVILRNLTRRDEEPVLVDYTDPCVWVRPL